MASHPHFAEEPPQILGQSDLDRANEKLEIDGDRSSNEQSETHGKSDGEKLEKLGTYDKYELTEDDCYEELGFGFPKWKKVSLDIKANRLCD